MSQAYTPGLQVKERMLFRVHRLLPIQGMVLKQVGDYVQAQQVVARSEQPGEVTPVNLANVLAVSAGELPKLLTRQVGQAVSKGDLLARTNGIFGLFPTQFHAPSEGTIESVSKVTGQMILRGAPIPVEVKAFATGTVVEIVPQEGVVIESQATFIQGIFGIGGETYGELRLVTNTPRESILPEHLDESCRGCIVVGGARIHGDTIRRGVELGVSAIIGGGIDDQDLREILGYDLGVAVTGTEQVGMTVIITEGFGDIDMADRTFDLLRSRAGSLAAVSGATQIRAGVQRPEIVIPWPDQSTAYAEQGERMGGGTLGLGTPVRMIRDPYFGRLGHVSGLPIEQQTLETGSKARVLEVTCHNGDRITVPRANVEITGG